MTDADAQTDADSREELRRLGGAGSVIDADAQTVAASVGSFAGWANDARLAD